MLGDNDATLSVARYIFEKPVRAGLVASPYDYAFLGSERYTVQQILEVDSWQPFRAAVRVATALRIRTRG